MLSKRCKRVLAVENSVSLPSGSVPGLTIIKQVLHEETLSVPELYGCGKPIFRKFNVPDFQRNLHLNGTRLYSCCIGLNDTYILSAVRTPIGCFQGKLASLTATQLATKALASAVEKSNLNKDDIQEIIVGNTFGAGLGQAPAHQAALFAGLSHSIISTSVNKLCGSGMKAVMLASQLIMTNAQEVVACGGMESLTNVPYILKRKRMRLGNICVPDMIFHDGLIDVFEQTDVTFFAEEIAKEYKYTRKEQDDYTVLSYNRAIKARNEGVFERETVPIILKGKTEDQDEAVCFDEQMNKFDEKKLRELKPEVGKDGTITPGNASSLNDGAAMLILASGNYVLKKNLQPLARIVSFADASVEPKKFVISPSVVIPKVLVRSNLTVKQIARWEINETFAVTAMLNMKILKLDPDLVNVHGGALSLGHPFGMSGARLIVHLVHTLNVGEVGCACISHAAGGGSAVIVEKMN